MSESKDRITAFTDLRTWQKGHKLVIAIYDATRSFPREEVFGLCLQLRRAVVSFTSNIAEGFSRNSSREKAQFYSIALGSLTEVQNQVIVARDVGYIPRQQCDTLLGHTEDLHKMTNGLIKKAQSRDSG